MPASTRLPPPEILLEQGAVILCNKPGGLLTQGPPGIDSLELRVKQFLIQRENKPGKAYLGVPHRLDRPVSGVMVVVKNVRAAKRISEQIQNRTVRKLYWAVVEGRIGQPGDAGVWQDWMRKIPDEAKSEIIAEDHPDARRALLRFRVLATVGKWPGDTFAVGNRPGNRQDASDTAPGSASGPPNHRRSTLRG